MTRRMPPRCSGSTSITAARLPFDDLFAEIWRRVYAFRQRSSKVPKNFLKPAEAQLLVAQDAGFGSWDALMQSLETGAPPIPPYVIDTQRNAIGPRRLLERSRVGCS